MIQHSSVLVVMERAAKEAGVSLLKDFTRREMLLIESKNPGDFVSEADRASEQIIVRVLRDAYPEWGILGEEGTDYAVSDDGYRWIIDPLDGTSNFLYGIPHWCLTIALEHQGEIVAGLIYDPIRDEMFVAEQGKGATLNGVRLNIANTADDVYAPIGVAINLHKEAYNRLEQLIYTQDSFRVMYSAALDIAYTACGRFRSCVIAGVKAWDIAAGIILVKEAGGIVTDIQLNSANHHHGEAIGGNAAVHARITKLLELN